MTFSIPMQEQQTNNQASAEEPGPSAMTDGQGPKRRHRRFDVALEVAFDNFPSRLVQRATNISKSGVFVKTEALLPLNTNAILRLTLPTGEHLTTAAEVIHVVTPEQASGQTYPSGLGLRFVQSKPEFRRRLSAFIADLQSGYPRILIVDDDEDFRAALSDGLGALGMTVDYAGSGEEALRKLVENLFQIDLVLLDVRMPGLDGRGFLHRVRMLGGELDLPIVVLSAAPRAELQTLKGPNGANDILSKNDRLEDIAARVKDVLGR